MAATRRINLMDAVQERSVRAARSCTALVRIGTVVAVDGTIAEVTVGGATFTAGCFATVEAGDVVALLTDTDAWWVLGKATGQSGGPPPGNPIWTERELLTENTQVVAFNIPTGLISLQLRYFARSAYSAFLGDSVFIQLNNDVTSMYRSVGMQATGTGLAHVPSVSTTAWLVGVSATALGDANQWATGVVEFTGIDTGHPMQTYNSFTGPTDAMWHMTGGGSYVGATGPLTVLKIFAEHGPWVTGSDFQLIGRRAA